MWDRGYDNYPALENSFFGAVKLVKNADVDEYKYSGYVIGFERHGNFSVANGFNRNVIIFGVDISSNLHVDSKKKYILVLSESPTQGLDDTVLTAEKKYSINFTEHNKKFCLSLHYNGEDSHLLVNDVEIIACLAKDSEINAILLCLGNTSEDHSIDKMKKDLIKWICL